MGLLRYDLREEEAKAEAEAEANNQMDTLRQLLAVEELDSESEGASESDNGDMLTPYWNRSEAELWERLGYDSAINFVQGHSSRVPDPSISAPSRPSPGRQ